MRRMTSTQLTRPEMSKTLSRTAERDRQALELRQAGMSFGDIAVRLGYANKGSACKAYQRALERSGALDATPQDARRLEAERLDRMQAAIWAKAARGDLSAVDRVLKISVRRAKLLGLDGAPWRPALVQTDDQQKPAATVVPASRVDALRERREREAAERAAGG